MIRPPMDFGVIVVGILLPVLCGWFLVELAMAWRRKKAPTPTVTPTLHFGYFGRCGLCAAPLRALTCDVTVATGAVEYATCRECADLLEHAGAGR